MGSLRYINYSNKYINIGFDTSIRMEDIVVNKSLSLKEHTGLMIVQIILSVFAIIMIIPFLWMISSSLKMNTEVTKIPFQFFPKKIRWDNYLIIFQRAPMLSFMLNSFKVSISSILGLLAVNTMAAYTFAKLKFKGRDQLFLLFLGLMMIPSSVMLIPRYMLFDFIGLLDSHLALILPAFFSPFYMFMIRQYIMGIPDELIESSKMDGANHFYILYKIIIPNIIPILATVFMLSFIANWNDFLNPLVYMKTVSKYTVPLGIQSFNSSHLSMRAWSCAASLVALTPLFVIFLLGQKYILESMVMSGIKG